MAYTKNENETNHQFIYRVCRDKELNGWSWEEISELCNEELALNYSESWYRRRWSGYKDIADANVDTDKLSQLEELKSERRKIQTAAVELNRLNRQNSRFEMFYESVKEAIEKLPVPEFQYYDNLGQTEKEYVLTIADIHAGANFNVLNNRYSFDECQKRFEYLLNKTIGYVQDNNITKISVLELGDSIQGLIRVSDLKLNETSVVEATIFVAKLISGFLNSLSEYCRVEYYHTPTANHSQMRNLGTKANELACEDLEYVIGNYINDVLENNPNVTVNLNFGEEFIRVSIFNFEAIAMHGHQIKSIKTAIQQLTMQHRVFFDYLFMAHYHASEEIVVGEGENDCEVLICPSFVGSCPYSQSLMKGSKSACKVFVFDKYDGHVGTEKFILN